MRAFVASALLALALPAQAQQVFLQADKVPASSTDVQPDQYRCSFLQSGQTAPSVRTIVPTKNTDGSVQLSQDISTLALPVGVYTSVTCIAMKAGYADSPPSNSIQLALGVLKAPTIVIITK